MTNPTATQEPALDVAQEDREAAADYDFVHSVGPRSVRKLTADEMRAGEHDRDPLIQAFARHRHAALASARAREAELRAALEAGRQWLEAKDAFAAFERDNPNDCTKRWDRLLYAMGDAEDAFRAALAQPADEGEVK